jgi:hypothetical protein
MLPGVEYARAMKVRALFAGLALPLFVALACSTRAHAQRESVSGRVTIVRVGMFVQRTGDAPKPSLTFRIAGYARTFVVDLDSRRDDDGSFASRMHMADFIERALASGRVVTVEAVSIAGEVYLVKSVQIQADPETTRPPASTP